MPQLFGSVDVTTQRPMLIVVPDGHAHAPETQVAPGPQFLPQPPQLFGSLLTSAHCPPHITVFAGQ
jgi:hypothetical protein